MRTAKTLYNQKTSKLQKTKIQAQSLKKSSATAKYQKTHQNQPQMLKSLKSAITQVIYLTNILYLLQNITYISKNVPS